MSFSSAKFRRPARSVSFSGVSPVHTVHGQVVLTAAAAGSSSNVLDVVTGLPIVIPSGAKVVKAHMQSLEAPTAGAGATISLGANAAVAKFVDAQDATADINADSSAVHIATPGKVLPILVGAIPDGVKVVVAGGAVTSARLKVEISFVL